MKQPPATRGFSFVNYILSNGKTFLGENQFISTTAPDGSTRRTCDNCTKRCVIGQGTGNNMIRGILTDCSHPEVKMLFNAGGCIMPKTLHSQPVGNFCIHFEKCEVPVEANTFVEESTTTTTPAPTFVEKTEVKQEMTSTVQDMTDMNFCASKKGKNYYAVGTRGHKDINVENRLYFKTAEEAEAAGYSSPEKKTGQKNKGYKKNHGVIF